METREILQIIMAGLGSIGFALIFQLRGTKLITIGLGGALAWFIFLIGRMRENAMIGLFLAVTVAALIAELQARIRRTPVLVMEVPLLVPLIPGGDLYRMTVSIMKNGIQASLGAFVWLVQEVFIIAAGVICVQTVVTAVVKLQRSRRHTESSTMPSLPKAAAGDVPFLPAVGDTPCASVASSVWETATRFLAE